MWRVPMVTGRPVGRLSAFETFAFIGSSSAVLRGCPTPLTRRKSHTSAK